MSRKSFRLCTKFLAVLVSALILLALSGPASAQEESLPDDSACQQCHQDRYWLFDRGNWVCFCAMQARCTVCHGGQDGTMDQDRAHEGMIASPLQDNLAVCQGCHAEDYQARAIKIAAAMGITTTLYNNASLGTPPILKASVAATTNPLLEGQPRPLWQMIGLSLVALASIGIFLFGCRCWKLDHPAAG